MKIDTKSQTTLPKPAVSRATPANNQSNTSSAVNGDGREQQSVSGGRDFASVLEESARYRGGAEESFDSNDSSSARLKDDVRRHDAEVERNERAADKASRAKTNPDQEGDGQSSGDDADKHQAVANPMQFREGLPRIDSGAAVNARAILHVVDLERIVAMVRTQSAPGGRQEISLRLSRSVLEGLQVKLTRDPSGSIEAEFIAASERVRAQLEARSADLTDLLRSRGVNIASLKTSIGTGDSGQSQHEQSGQSGAHGGPLQLTDSINRADASGGSPLTDVDDSGVSISASADGPTYRA